MPCQTDPIPYDPTPTRILCAVLTVLEHRHKLDKVLTRVDWKEAGVTESEARTWWTRHQKEDARRRKQEADVAQQRKIANATYQKLSARERTALGLRAPR